jgi:pimeloyl-ACP methyl ester carboxylesterase
MSIDPREAKVLKRTISGIQVAAAVLVLPIVLLAFVVQSRSMVAVPCTDNSGFDCGLVKLDSPTGTRAIAFAWERADPEQRTMVIIGGGPGQGIVQDADILAPGLHDSFGDAFRLLFVDMFGVGRAGGIECTAAEAERDKRISGAVTAVDYVSAARGFAEACMDQLDRDANQLGAFSTFRSAADLDALRDQLDLESWDLYGQSYGTRVAQVYASQYSDRVGALVLDAPVELRPTVALWRERGKAFEAALEEIFDWCRRDAGCIDSLGRDPAMAYTIMRQRLGSADSSEAEPIGPGALDAFAATLLTNRAGRLDLLRLMVETRRGDWAGLLATLERAAEQPEPADPGRSGFSDGAYYAVQCADWSWDTWDTADRSRQLMSGLEVDGVMRPESAVILRDLPCAFWPSASPPQVALGLDGHRVAILSAPHDWPAPPSIAEQLASSLPNASLVMVRGGAHVSLGRGVSCADEAVQGFLAAPSAPSASRIECSVPFVAAAP